MPEKAKPYSDGKHKSEFDNCFGPGSGENPNFVCEGLGMSVTPGSDAAGLYIMERNKKESHVIMYLLGKISSKELTKEERGMIKTVKNNIKKLDYDSSSEADLIKYAKEEHLRI